MRNVLFAIAAILAITTVAIGVYLTPDDLSKCRMVLADSDDCAPADAIIAISGGNTPVRTAEAIRLYQDGWAERLIFSGAAADMSGPSNAEVMRRQALDAGVPTADIFTEELSQTTKENAQRTKDLLISKGIRRVILVTSAYHQRRASLEFRTLAGDGITIINHPAPDDPDWPAFWWLTPRGWWLAGGELVKITAFYLGESR